MRRWLRWWTGLRTRVKFRSYVIYSRVCGYEWRKNAFASIKNRPNNNKTTTTSTSGPILAFLAAKYWRTPYQIKSVCMCVRAFMLRVCHLSLSNCACLAFVWVCVWVLSPSPIKFPSGRTFQEQGWAGIVAPTKTTVHMFKQKWSCLSKQGVLKNRKLILIFFFSIEFSYYSINRIFTKQPDVRKSVFVYCLKSYSLMPWATEISFRFKHV